MNFTSAVLTIRPVVVVIVRIAQIQPQQYTFATFMTGTASTFESGRVEGLGNQADNIFGRLVGIQVNSGHLNETVSPKTRAMD